MRDVGAHAGAAADLGIRGGVHRARAGTAHTTSPLSIGPRPAEAPQLPPAPPEPARPPTAPPAVAQPSQAQPPPAPAAPSPAPPRTPAPPAARGRNIVLNFDNADIETVIQAASEIVGFNYVLAPDVRGKVTVQTAGRIPQEDVLGVLLAILEVHGFTAIKSGNLYKMVQDRGRARARSSHHHRDERRERSR